MNDLMLHLRRYREGGNTFSSFLPGAHSRLLKQMQVLTTGAQIKRCFLSFYLSAIPPDTMVVQEETKATCRKNLVRDMPWSYLIVVAGKVKSLICT